MLLQRHVWWLSLVLQVGAIVVATTLLVQRNSVSPVALLAVQAGFGLAFYVMFFLTDAGRIADVMNGWSGGVHMAFAGFLARSMESSIEFIMVYALVIFVLSGLVLLVFSVLLRPTECS